MLKEWETYYLMLGSAGAGLIGLLFVVVTLTASFDQSVTSRGVRYFLGPTIFDFSVVLTMSAIAIAPELSAAIEAVLFVLVATLGIGFAVRSSVGIQRPAPAGVEPPDWTDLWMYGVFPAMLYAGIVLASIPLAFEVRLAPLVIAALVLCLLLLGIRNAWDLLIWITPRSRSRP